ncbi:aryl-alcohol dehydrogenase-like predicted oxidoreductase [Sphingomonas naasensis]|nr:aldo/keto reductase [Sphingomonas naasensis]NIJ19021.1 aryl-alcohol dehydrogenase-like predicted oxidoreductase [Sphingomonas naasensis]
MIRFRPLGRTGLNLSELAIGTAALRSAARDPGEAGAMLARALALGINTVEIDSSDAETATLLGDILRREGARHRVHVIARAASLVPFDLPSPHVPADQAYPGWHLRAATEALLGRLGVERLALQQLHAWCPEWRGEGDWRQTLETLRAEGKIAGIGVSLFDHDVAAGLEIVASGTIDAVELMYNVFDQGAAAALFPLCQGHGVGVVVRSPLYFGALAARPDGAMPGFSTEDWRTAYFYDAHRRETEARVQRLAPAVVAPDRSVADLALRFALSHPAVSTVAVGMRTCAQLEANAAAIQRGPLDTDRLAALAAHKWLC